MWSGGCQFRRREGLKTSTAKLPIVRLCDSHPIVPPPPSHHSTCYAYANLAKILKVSWEITSWGHKSIFVFLRISVTGIRTFDLLAEAQGKTLSRAMVKEAVPPTVGPCVPWHNRAKPAALALGSLGVCCETLNTPFSFPEHRLPSQGKRGHCWLSSGFTWRKGRADSGVWEALAGRSPKGTCHGL